MKICKPILTLLAVSPLLLASPAKAAGHPEANDPTVELARKLVLKERPPLTAAELAKLSPEKQAALLGVLKNDPRPGYQHNPDRVYTLDFGENRVRFTVAENTLTVREIL